MPVVFGRNAAPVLEVKYVAPDPVRRIASQRTRLAARNTTKNTDSYRPDSPFVVFYGETSEAQDAELTGKLVLTNSESMSVKSIRVTLTGMRKVSWHTTNSVRASWQTRRTSQVFVGSTPSRRELRTLWMTFTDDDRSPRSPYSRSRTFSSRPSPYSRSTDPRTSHTRSTQAYMSGITSSRCPAIWRRA